MSGTRPSATQFDGWPFKTQHPSTLVNLHRRLLNHRFRSLPSSLPASLPPSPPCYLVPIIDSLYHVGSTASQCCYRRANALTVGPYVEAPAHVATTRSSSACRVVQPGAIVQHGDCHSDGDSEPARVVTGTYLWLCLGGTHTPQ